VLDFVRGQVHAIAEDAAVISVGGVGIRVEMPTPDLARLSGEVTVHTVLQIREDEVHLYGFATTHSRELFGALTSVGGVGPRLALAILSFHPAEGLERAIASGDADALALVSGVGKKTANRIVLELRDRFGPGARGAEVAAAPSGSAIGEVREALKAMGFSTSEIQDVLATLPPDGDAPTLLRHALKSMGSREQEGAKRLPQKAAVE
jgi:Holliday junction DNA helicase RuvA